MRSTTRRTSISGADLPLASQPGRIDFFRPVDQVAVDAAGHGDFLEAPRVGTVRAADDDDQVALAGQRLDGILAVPGAAPW
jgi:hypothetical protein